MDDRVEAVAGRALRPWARGGMPTKLEAARLVTTSGIPMIMCHGRAEDAVLRAVAGERIGTYFHAAESKLEARKRWMLGGISQQGQVTVDGGAADALLKDHRSLLPAGVRAVDGGFQRGDTIFVIGPSGQRIALWHRQLLRRRCRTDSRAALCPNRDDSGLPLRAGNRPPQQSGPSVNP